MKRFLCMILCLSLTVCLFGCEDDTPYVPTGDGLTWDDEVVTVSTEPEQERELVLVYYPEASMNPILSTNFTNRVLFSLMYQGLFIVDSDYNVEPMLCKSYMVSDDMKTYTFYVDEKATFSDGSPVTAQDVLASYLAADEYDYFGGRFRHFKEAYLSADGGVTFKLSTAMENLPLLLDFPILKESEVLAERPLGTGPYFLAENISGLYLRRRNDWWCSADLIFHTSAITLIKAESPAQIRDEFEFGDVGLVCADPGSDKYADFRSDYELWNCENGIFLYIGCNVADSPIFTNTKVRSALTYAIDRETLVNDFYRGFALAATLPASPLSPYYSEQLATRYEYDPERFKEVLAAEGMLGMPLRLLVNKEDTLRLRVARRLGEILTEYGFVVQMLEYGRQDYLYCLGVENYDLYLGQTKLSPNMDLTRFFEDYGTFRYGGMTDASLYALCMDALANEGNYYNLHKNIVDDGRLCPVLFHSYAVYATRGLLTELTPSRDNVFYYSIGKRMQDALMYND